MIVKDEVDVLASCLDSCRELIDYWVICDTGSTDGTQDLIRRELAGIPGELHETEWIDFGHNRSEVMALARGKADYLLLMDADWEIEATREQLAGLKADSYAVRFGTGIDFWRPTLVRSSLDWRFVGRVHEYLHCDSTTTTERLDGVAIRLNAIGGGAKGRWESDLRILHAELERDPHDARSAFYLAQTYRDLGNLEDDEEKLRHALHWYRRRTELAGWVEETYCAWRQVGALCERLGDWPSAVDAYLQAWQVRPERLEALHALAVGLRLRGLHVAAHRFTSLAAGPTRLSVPRDLLFVEPWIYRWGLLFEYSITAYWCGEYEATITACRRLLKMEELPENHRRQTVANMEFALKAKVHQAAAAPVVQSRRMKAPGTPTRGLRAPDALTPYELRATGLARRVAALCGLSVHEADRVLMGLGRPVQVVVPQLAPWPIRVRPGTSDVAVLDRICNGTLHLPPEPLEDPGLIVDLGAGIGITALDLARRHPTARLIAVEMDAGSVELAVHNLGPLGDRVTVVGAAIDAANGEVNYTTAGDPGHHALAPDGEGRASAITLDTLFEHTALGRVVDYLKMSIEGTEAAVLRPESAWPASVGSVTVVTHGDYDPSEDLQRLGFSLAAIDEDVARVCGVRAAARPYRARARMRRPLG